MKQIAQYQDGRLEFQEVPAPQIPPGGALIRTTSSVISIGTERMKLEQAKMNLLQKAKARPDQVRKVLETAKNLGWQAAFEKVKNRLESPTPLGYSAAGIIEDLHPQNTRLRRGMRVACAGAECAFHAEYLAMPDLLMAQIPDGVEDWQAAYATVSSIALQGVRQAQISVGERVVVIGQGLIGLLVTNLLEISGARPMAVDVNPTRREIASAMGAERVVIAGEDDLLNDVRFWTDGYGADCVILCTAGKNNAPLEQAAAILRDRGRIVIIGNTRADLDWKVFYEKELDVRYSRSYGPGRYDPGYEWGGVDYPIGYVRWTEQRNMESCLNLMRERKLRLDILTSKRAPFENAVSVYREIEGGADYLGVVLEYAASPIDHAPMVKISAEKANDKGMTRKPVNTLDVIGAGNFARSMLLPHLRGKTAFGSIANQSALSSRHVKEKFGFKTESTDSEKIIQKNSDHALLIGTRNHLHAPQVIAGLKANRHIFVEKPLCLNAEELAAVEAAAMSSTGSVMVGFNRRFAPAAVALKKLLDKTSGPKVIACTIHAGRLDPHHWYANFEESGGRIVSEGCHFFDFFNWLCEGENPKRLFANPIGDIPARLPFPDSISCQIEFSKGSTAQFTYSAEGHASFPKESILVSAPGLVARIENFQSLETWSKSGHGKNRFTSKGHAEEMSAWRSFLSDPAMPHPLSLSEASRSMRLTFAAIQSIQKSCAIEFSS